MEKLAKKFNYQDNEKFCIFVTKDKRQAIISTMSYIEYLQVLTANAVWKFLFLIVIFSNYFKDDKGNRFDDTKEVQYLYKTFFVKHTS